MQQCPCHSSLPYNNCCQRFHEGALPSNALELMRSRYCAYALGLVDYIIKTTHPKNPSYSSNFVSWKQALQVFCTNTQFKDLEIVHFEEHGPLATVCFIAYLKQQAEEVELIENSSFKKENTQWLYLTGTLYATRQDLS